MKKKILFVSFDLEIGGVERSLIGLLNSIDYEEYDVDLFLYNHKGDFFSQIPSKVNLLREIPEFTTFRKPIKEVFRSGHLLLGLVRLFAKLVSLIKYKLQGIIPASGYMVRTFKYSLPFLPKIDGNYDLAISYLTPHYTVINKVSSKVKIGFIHSDYSNERVGVDTELEYRMWGELDYIAAVSDGCKEAFIKIFPELKKKCFVSENILSPEFVRFQAKIKIPDDMPNDGSIKLCSVGRFSYQKGFDLAVISCKKLVEMGYNVKWYVIGYGGDEYIINKAIKDNNMENNFIILGKRINPYPYIDACDIYVQPSRYEGKAVTVREAQMLGKPVVISNYATSNSQLKNGFDGHVCEMGINGLTEGIKRLIDDVQYRNKIAHNSSIGNYGNQTEINKLYKLF